MLVIAQPIGILLLNQEVLYEQRPNIGNNSRVGVGEDKLPIVKVVDKPGGELGGRKDRVKLGGSLLFLLSFYLFFVVVVVGNNSRVGVGEDKLPIVKVVDKPGGELGGRKDRVKLGGSLLFLLSFYLFFVVVVV
ncbi:uncharacterized protein A4U43_C04F30930 [Asparagus officinalis]|uniref:Transmembrane protein n=1 Tax=Asparagus officinalis TaxID=4686 RepID=A0A5P1F4T4_ASPOF|nr:uncharacterized protein A4U43_C04F30930 [Asparagus officinalis]